MFHQRTQEWKEIGEIFQHSLKIALQRPDLARRRFFGWTIDDAPVRELPLNGLLNSLPVGQIRRTPGADSNKIPLI